jgi:hypothetical protein
MSQRLLARKPANASAETQRTRSGLKLSELGDTFEQEADRVADAVVSGSRVPAWSIAKIGMGAGTNTIQRDTPDGSGQPQQTPKPNNYDEAAKKAAEAFMQTDAGKKLLQAVESDPLVKDAKDLVTTLPGILITGTAAAGAVSALAAAHKALPMQVPAIPLDSISPKLKGIKLNLSWEGPVDKPTKATIGFSGTFGGGGDKKAATRRKTTHMSASPGRRNPCGQAWICSSPRTRPAPMTWENCSGSARAPRRWASALRTSARAALPRRCPERKVHHITNDEVIGLHNPCNPSEMSPIERPIESMP